MKITEYKQIDTRYEEVQMPVLDEEGNETGEFQTIRKAIPVMGMVYRDATDEEEAEMLKAQAEMQTEQTEEVTIADLVEALDILTSIVLGGEE